MISRAAVAPGGQSALEPASAAERHRGPVTSSFRYGGLNGRFEWRITSPTPSPTPGVYSFGGGLVLETAGGELHRDLNGALNSAETSQTEFGEIGVVTGGTGAYRGASGHLRLYGPSRTGPVIPPTGSGDYRTTDKTD